MDAHRLTRLMIRDEEEYVQWNRMESERAGYAGTPRDGDHSIGIKKSWGSSGEERGNQKAFERRHRA